MFVMDSGRPIAVADSDTQACLFRSFKDIIGTK